MSSHRVLLLVSSVSAIIAASIARGNDHDDSGADRARERAERAHEAASGGSADRAGGSSHDSSRERPDAAQREFDERWREAVRDALNPGYGIRGPGGDIVSPVGNESPGVRPGGNGSGDGGGWGSGSPGGSGFGGLPSNSWLAPTLTPDEMRYGTISAVPANTYEIPYTEVVDVEADDPVYAKLKAMEELRARGHSPVDARVLGGVSIGAPDGLTTGYYSVEVTTSEWRSVPRTQPDVVHPHTAPPTRCVVPNRPDRYAGDVPDL
jgi:hypothetical protein